jgi:flagellar basal-body rod protein FlgC
MNIGKLFGGLSISSAALSAQRKRMNAIAENIANAETTRTEQGTPYRRKIVKLTSSLQHTFSSFLQKAGIELATTKHNHITGGPVAFTDPEESLRSVGAVEVEDLTPFKQVYDPSHPDADEQGYVQMPNVSVVAEMVEMISASRAYEANATVIAAAKNIAKDALEI